MTNEGNVDHNRVATYCVFINDGTSTCGYCPYTPDMCNDKLHCRRELVDFLRTNLDMIYCFPDGLILEATIDRLISIVQYE